MAMLPTGQLRFAHGLLWTALLALGMQSDPLFAQTSEESKSDIKDGLVVLVAVELRRDLEVERSASCRYSRAVPVECSTRRDAGLQSNTFFDREAGKVRYCLEDDDPGTLVSEEQTDAAQGT